MRYLMKSIPRSWLGLQTPRCTSFSSLKAYASFRMSSGKTATLNTGYKIPQLGYGTWQAGPGEVGNGVYEALKIGYRHLDLAKMYVFIPHVLFHLLARVSPPLPPARLPRQPHTQR
ncbi:D/L-glyceraldehyde reductase [Ascochyta rabiei]|uniref:D/L-glyceraldehyde reductase n=1 Tax=Didymella rabiei TaxID=5454 RepID=UPI00220690F1|nr:D/L-glyceraldehyde reductase [Ascochyta rabiei]UPX12232.1 D/L-glyceraldehyde reductase [Ascochyta rabiei]